MHPFPKPHTKFSVPSFPDVWQPASHSRLASTQLGGLTGCFTTLGCSPLVWRWCFIKMIHTLFQNALKVPSEKWWGLEWIIFKEMNSLSIWYFYNFEKYWHLKLDLKMVWGICVWVTLYRHLNNLSLIILSLNKNLKWMESRTPKIWERKGLGKWNFFFWKNIKVEGGEV